jgi:hypothetical protein
MIRSLLAFLLFSPAIFCQTPKVSSALSIARIQYAGGGDWYNDPSAEVNLLRFVRTNLGIEVDARYQSVKLTDESLFEHPLVFLTGHGNIQFSDVEARRLRTYLESGGFVIADDDYGMDKSFRREMKKVLPESEFIELPLDHDIYRTPYLFSDGPPKTHEHDSHPAQGFGLFYNNRMVVFYSFESNPSDGWTDPEVHKDPEEKRQEALRYGANIIAWALRN